MALETAANAEPQPDPELDQFTDLILEHADEGDGESVRREDLAELAREIWSFAETRTPGTPKIRTRTAEHEHRRRTILEVVTDDMPFLVASILGQLSDFDATITWFGHPIVAVERSDDGRRARLVGSRREANPLDEALPGVEVESTIVVVFDRVFDPATASLAEQRVKKSLGRCFYRRGRLAAAACAPHGHSRSVVGRAGGRRSRLG